ncbi:mitogen-activated protein kinase kinase kinase YODA [Prunus yedoensis var. nudiflora]|uniref:Mitogen-activated protein kinase kinase kinase YODA n=1 Tax=Prunus yedoensis var. nudiflora TaxID=2094558 RepID=A0A314Y853_PRUYE|nr:mitogen-activated protein kinase kinase kinase YODA [Prunus yedoensis var. nudiflora]
MAGLKRKRATHDEIIVADDFADHADHYLTVSLSGCEWVRGPMLGQGGFGSVYLGFVKKPRLCLKGVPRIVAVKSTLASQAHDLMGKIFFFTFFVAALLLSTAMERMRRLALMAYADGGTMADLIEKSRGFGLREFQVRKYTESILKGIKYIHERGFVHCDLKPENILLVSDTTGSFGGARFVPKIGDLGLTKKANQKWEKPSFGGTPMYLSPEAVVYGIQQPSDIWALGCVVLQMLTGRHPWDFTPGTEILPLKLMSRHVVPSPKPSTFAIMGAA